MAAGAATLPSLRLSVVFTSCGNPTEMLRGIILTVELLRRFKKSPLAVTKDSLNGNLRPSAMSNSRPSRHTEHNVVEYQLLS
jgi:hypothetical protein